MKITRDHRADRQPRGLRTRCCVVGCNQERKAFNVAETGAKLFSLEVNTGTCPKANKLELLSSPTSQLNVRHHRDEQQQLLQTALGDLLTNNELLVVMIIIIIMTHHGMSCWSRGGGGGGGRGRVKKNKLNI